MKTVLIITYFFPPYAGGGVYRILKFVKYLPLFGWEPVVLAPKPKGYYWAFDKSLLGELPKGLSIHKTFAFEPFYLDQGLNALGLNRLSKALGSLFLPDDKVGWIPWALSQALRVMRNHPIDLIFTSSPPHSVHLIGYLLKRLTRKKWVADFRDHWTLAPSYSPVSSIRRRIQKGMEAAVLKSCDRAVLVNDGNRKEVLEAFHVPKERTVTITNGYDPEDFDHTQSEQRGEDRFVITYAGSFYGDRTPEYLLRSIRLLLERVPHLESHLRVNINGVMEERFRDLFNDSRLGSVVKINGFVPHDQLIRQLVSSDLLLHLIPIGKEYRSVGTGKIYEYLATGKPILGLVFDGIAADILAKSGLGMTVQPTDVEKIADALHGLYLRHREGKLSVNPNWEFIRQFDRRNLTRKLARAFDTLAAGRD